ncbi:hypothetical protein [Haloterrigena salinisoli]|uniref:hypothetical protein n=1 Tax=Haloterrigena salinisoli TaxID=3132747 RepID=UPI0030D16CB6
MIARGGTIERTVAAAASVVGTLAGRLGEPSDDSDGDTETKEGVFEDDSASAAGDGGAAADGDEHPVDDEE